MSIDYIMKPYWRAVDYAHACALYRWKLTPADRKTDQLLRDFIREEMSHVT